MNERISYISYLFFPSCYHWFYRLHFSFLPNFTTTNILIDQSLKVTTNKIKAMLIHKHNYFTLVAVQKHQHFFTSFIFIAAHYCVSSHHMYYIVGCAIFQITHIFYEFLWKCFIGKHSGELHINRSEFFFNYTPTNTFSAHQFNT